MEFHLKDYCVSPITGEVLVSTTQTHEGIYQTMVFLIYPDGSIKSEIKSCTREYHDKNSAYEGHIQAVKDWSIMDLKCPGYSKLKTKRPGDN